MMLQLQQSETRPHPKFWDANEKQRMNRSCATSMQVIYSVQVYHCEFMEVVVLPCDNVKLPLMFSLPSQLHGGLYPHSSSLGIDWCTSMEVVDMKKAALESD